MAWIRTQIAFSCVYARRLVQKTTAHFLCHSEESCHEIRSFVFLCRGCIRPLKGKSHPAAQANVFLWGGDTFAEPAGSTCTVGEKERCNILRLRLFELRSVVSCFTLLCALSFSGSTKPCVCFITLSCSFQGKLMFLLTEAQRVASKLRFRLFNLSANCELNCRKPLAHVFPVICNSRRSLIAKTSHF